MAVSKDYYDGWVLANGIRTHYSWAGTEGPAIILIHGGGPGASGASGWRFMLPALAEAGFRAFAPDQLSMGWTDARPHAWPILGHQSLVDHIADFVDALCLEEVGVVGNSQGAYVSAKYTLDNPEKVSGVFFIGSGTICSAVGIPQAPNRAMQSLRDYDYTPEGMRKFLEAIIHNPANVTNELVQSRHEAATRPGIREARAAFESYRTAMEREPKLKMRFSLEHSMPRFPVPAQFIWGKDDKFAPVTMGYELEKLLPNIPFQYIDDCGHQCQNDQPDIVNELVIKFFKNHAPRVDSGI